MNINHVNAEEGWVIFLDIYGFSSIVESWAIERESDPTYTEGVECLISAQQSAISVHSSGPCVPQIFKFSDSLFLFYEVAPGEDKYIVLEKCFEQIKTVMSIYATEGLPLRGGIAYGKVWWTQELLIGQPVFKAYKYEQEIPAPVVWLPAHECRSHPHSIIPDSIAPYFKEITKKDGSPVLGVPLMPYDISAFAKLVNDMYLKYVILSEPSGAAKTWKTAMDWVSTHIEQLRSS